MTDILNAIVTLGTLVAGAQGTIWVLLLVIVYLGWQLWNAQKEIKLNELARDLAVTRSDAAQLALQAQIFDVITRYQSQQINTTDMLVQLIEVIKDMRGNDAGK